MACGLILASPATVFAAEEGEAGLFDISGGLIVWTLVVFVSLMLLLRRFAWGPILAALDAREKGIQDAIDRAAEEREAASRLLAEHRQQLAEARQEAQAIVSESREAGERLRKELEVKAKEEGQALLEQARREIGRERDLALDTLRRESVELALAAAARLLTTRLDAESDRELVMGYLDELGGGSGGSGDGASA